MLQVSAEQSDALQQKREPLLAAKIVRFTEQSQPAALVGIETPNEKASAGIAIARERGLESDTAVGLFVMTMFTVGPRYYLEPECSDVLEDSSMPPDARVMRLFSPEVLVPWKILTERCKAQAW